ncbi:CPBP family intramembrane glutamic endopeptidase [Paenibacillus sp.]|jgi:membrane protease YdiL (CAAX protease family)|uniref:CPBP family intramembrane glutamic endopeptidase n=1 Tax=Paenibacillus sp. TaxID=58172 RepID=UPI00281F4BCB|nr:CPBP family intramembrane glutamic endopeptidase [Paenibacillus sp.]MDR0271266.1 CPBP family intramembrane metalloprotease [Paenibacillus sp.]
MKSAVSHRSLSGFLALIFAFAIPFWVVGAMTGSIKGMPMNLPTSALMFVCPAITAAILVYKHDRTEGVKRLLARVLDYKRIKHKIWYIPIIFIIPLTGLLSYAILRMLGLPLSGNQTQWLALPLLFILFFISAAFEELGWMGYAIEPMQEKWGALGGGLVLGCVWGIWHVIPLIEAHHPPAWIIAWFLGTVAARVIIVWVYNNTGKSIFGAIIIHTMLNVIDSFLPNYDASYVPGMTGILTAIAAIIVTFLWGSRTLARFRYA